VEVDEVVVVGATVDVEVVDEEATDDDEDEELELELELLELETAAERALNKVILFDPPLFKLALYKVVADNGNHHLPSLSVVTGTFHVAFTHRSCPSTVENVITETFSTVLDTGIEESSLSTESGTRFISHGVV